MPPPLKPSINDSSPEALMICFKIISHDSRDRLRGWHAALPGSRIEHILFGVYALIIPPGGARRLAR